MTTSRQSGRRYVRKGRRSVEAASDPSVSRLIAQAGHAEIEPLEQRKLLFTLTVTPDLDDGTGNGLVQTSFAYLAPYLYRDVDPADAPMMEGEEPAFGETLLEQLTGATISFYAPIGATVQVLDLYGVDMVNTSGADLIPFSGDDVIVGNDPADDMNMMVGNLNILIDANDDGIPDFNDGIGQIILTGTNAQSILTIYGTSVAIDTDTGFAVHTPIAGNTGGYDFFDEIGFGYDAVFTGMDVDVFGLPDGGVGSVFIGSPVVRDTASTTTYYGADGMGLQDTFVPEALTTLNVLLPALDFNNASQGIITANGETMGVVQIHGGVFGRSNFGAIERFNVGQLYGSLTVDGDMGSLIVANDSGVFLNSAGQFAGTGSQVVVERTLGEAAFGGRVGTSVEVVGDINNPALSLLDTSTHIEVEAVNFIPMGTPAGAVVASFQNATTVAGAGALFGDNYFRNDLLQSAEFVGLSGTAVTINGNIGFSDPINAFEDTADVYAFAADGTREVVLTSNLMHGGGYVRVLDARGEVVAAIEGGAAGQLSFTPDAPGIYYVVVSVNSNNGGMSGTGYNLALSGIAPTTFGSHRSAFGGGGLVTTLSGSMGWVRNGSALLQSGGMEEAFDAYMQGGDVTQVLSAGAQLVSVAGNLFEYHAGSDIGLGMAAPTINADGNIGAIRSGMSVLAVTTDGAGDFNGVTVNAGGSIGVIQAAGALGADTEMVNGPGTNTFNTGLQGGAGDIGAILVGTFVDVGSAAMPQVIINLTPGSVIDRFMVGTLPGVAGAGEIRGAAPVLFAGIGSDIRFVDFGQIPNAVEPDDAFLEFDLNNSVTIVDDAGASVTISIQGDFTPDPDEPDDIPRGEVRVLPINGSLGVAIGSITTFMPEGFNLVITSTGPGTVSIGRIILEAYDGAGEGPEDAGASNILIGGTAEVDVFRIDAAELGLVQNTTQGGDIVTIVGGGDIDAIDITAGNLGSTELSEWAPQRIGLSLGINSEIGGFPVIPGQAEGHEGNLLNGTITNGAAASWEDIGSPVDLILDGVITTGSINSITVSGSISDVISAGGILFAITANTDGITASGGFDGIIGNIYSSAGIGFIDIGDGLADTGASPFARAGIFAGAGIQQVFGGRGLNPTITGAIIANGDDIDFTPDDEDDEEVAGTLEFVNLQGTGGIVDAFLIGGPVDAFWQSARVADQALPRTSVDFVLVTGGGDMLRTEVRGTEVGTVQISGGAFDSSTVESQRNIDAIIADEFTARTQLDGTRGANNITATQDIFQLTATVGDMTDLTLDVGGSVTGSIFGRTITRSTFNVDNIIQAITASEDIRAINIIAGQLVLASADNDIRSTLIAIAGPISQVIAGNRIAESAVSSTGPDGRIDLVQATALLEADILASGSITRVQSLTDDVRGEIVTTDATDGDLVELIAAGDLDIDLDVLGDVTTIQAGGHIGVLGNPEGKQLLVGGNLVNLLSPNGQIYTEVLVGGSLLGSVQVGAVVALPTDDRVSNGRLEVYGRIELVLVDGDVAWDIVSHSGGIGRVEIINGSLRQNASITAFDGGIGQVLIRGGHLLGDIHADQQISLINVLAGNGFVGNIGVTSSLTTTTALSALRNALPPGTVTTAGADGPTISAGWNIGRVINRGSMFEATIVSNRAIGTVRIFGQVGNDALSSGQNTFVVGASLINKFIVDGNIRDTLVHAGLRDFGFDGTPGGTDDTVQTGRINEVLFKKSSARVTIAAGNSAGADGIYNNDDDRLAVGRSRITNISVLENANQTSAFAVNGVQNATSNVELVSRVGKQFIEDGLTVISPATGTRIDSGDTFNFTTTGGQSGTISFTGAGVMFWDAPNNRLTVTRTTLQTRLVVTSNTTDAEGRAFLEDIEIRTVNGPNLGFINIQADLKGDSAVYVDGFVNLLELRRVDITGTIGAGNNLRVVTIDRFDRGEIEARYIRQLTVNGDFGLDGEFDGAVINTLAALELSILGNMHGLINVERDVVAVLVGGAIERGAVRAGNTLNTLTAASANLAQISAGDRLLNVNIAGNFNESVLYAGGDLGSDGRFGGAGFAADRVSDGVIGTVFIGGTFLKSDIAAGTLRGTDGFIGTSDDVLDEGSSRITSVTIATNQVGSVVGSESYGIVSNGTIDFVSIGGLTDVEEIGNFKVNARDISPKPVTVTSATTRVAGPTFFIDIVFSESVDAATIPAALSIAEVRTGGDVALVQGLDYFIFFDANSRTLTVEFSRDLTERSVADIMGGMAGPGLHRVTINANAIRGETADARLDGNRDGATGDDYVMFGIIGDAGDRATSATTGGGIDLLAPVDLDPVFTDPNVERITDAEGISRTVSLSGSLGDHPDHNAFTFGRGGDVDLFAVTLQAGQLVRFDNFAGQAGGGATPLILDVNAQPLAGGEIQTINGSNFVQVSGVYTIAVVPNSLVQPILMGFIDLSDTTDAGIINAAITPGEFGSYSFSMTLFDDGDSGFAGPSDASDGEDLPVAPDISVFGPGNRRFTTGEVEFTQFAGADGVFDTADDVTRAQNTTRDITSVRRSGADGIWNTADDDISTTINASLGVAGVVGRPNSVFPDIDVYHLNNGDPVTVGSHIRVTLRLTERGSDLGAAAPGSVQLGIFDTTNSAAIGDGVLIASPEVSGNGGEPNDFIRDGDTAYGYDERGDFFLEFVVPDQLGGAGDPNLAVYLQGIFNSDYTLIVENLGTGQYTARSQNVLIETAGGIVDWLEEGELTTLGGFEASSLGFAGRVMGQTFDDFILSGLVANLNASFLAAGVDLFVSTDPADFLGENFSTVYLTSDQEPEDLIGSNTFGVSERLDAFNLDDSDQAVVFAPPFGAFVDTSVAGANDLIEHLTAAVGRRVGELVGLRQIGPVGALSDVMSANSVAVAPAGAPLTFSTVGVALSNAGDPSTDTDFFLGLQNSADLLDRVLAAP